MENSAFKKLNKNLANTHKAFKGNLKNKAQEINKKFKCLNFQQ